MIMKKEQLKKAYGEPTSGFHHSVMNALYHLDDKRSTVYRKQKILKIALVCGVVAAFGTFTVAATATSFFGLFAQPVGQYGVNIKTNEDSLSSEEMHYKYADNIKLSAAYIPEGYENTSGSEAAVMLRKSGDSYYNDAWYCRASVYEAKDFNITEYNVESQTELEDNGHKIVIIKHVVSANNLGLSYIAYKYFDVEQAVVEVVFEGMTRTGQAVIPEYEEVEKIVRGIQATQGEVSTSVSYGDDYTPGAISDYDPYEDVIGGNYTEISVGGEFKTEVANFDETAKSITVSFKSLTDMKDRNSLDRDGFYSAGEKISLADRFFDDDGKLIVEYDKEIVDDYGDGINSLPQTHVEKYHRHFIVAEVEVTAEEDITDLNKVMGAVAYSKTVDSLSMVDTELIYDSTIGPISVAKGETVTVTLGLITAEEAEGTAYFEISTMNDAASEGKVVLLNVNS